MKKYKFTQHVPTIVGITPKRFDFNDFNDLLETELFQKFTGDTFLVQENSIIRISGSGKHLFGTYELNEITISPSTHKSKEFDPFKNLGNKTEIDLIESIMKKPPIHIDPKELEEQSNSLGESSMKDDRTPEEQLGILW
jgi:hypothetical protein